MAFAKGSSSETSRDDDGWVVGGQSRQSAFQGQQRAFTFPLEVAQIFAREQQK